MTRGWRRVGNRVSSEVAALLVLLRSGLAVLVVLLCSTTPHPPRRHACSGALLCVEKEKDRWTAIKQYEIVYCFDGAAL
jgi:hypothetical protein